MSGSSSIIDSLIVELKLDASDFISSKDRAKEATAAIAAGVEDIDKAGDKAAKAQSQREKEAAARVKQEEREASKRTKEQQRVHEQALKENDRRDKAAVKEKDKARADDVRKEKESERERTLANRKAAKERKEGFDAAKEAALGFGAAVAGALAVEAIKATANSVADLGRTAHNLDLPIGEVAAFGNAVASAVGGNAQAAIGTLGNLSQALVGLRTGADITTLPRLMGQLSKMSGQQLTLKGPDGKFLNPEQLVMQFARAGEKMDPKLYSGLMSGLMDDGTINLTEKGPQAVQAAIDAAKKRGVPNPLEVREDAKVATAATDLEQSFERLRQQLTFKFGPDLVRLLKDVSSIGDVLSGKSSLEDLRASYKQHWHESEVDRLINRGVPAAKAEAEATAADKAAPRGWVDRVGWNFKDSYTYQGLHWLGEKAGIVDPIAPDGTGGPGATIGAPAGFRQSPVLPADIEAYVRKRALKRGLDPDHMVALFRAEKGGYDKFSPAGAFGPAQLMPKTAGDLGITAKPGDADYDWRQNADGGLRYYMHVLKKMHGNMQAADAAYNAGPNNSSLGRFAATGDDSGLPPETRHYIRQIQANLAPGANVASSISQVHGDTDNSSTVHIQKVEVNAARGDADAIAAGMRASMARHPLLTPQANTGLE